MGALKLMVLVDIHLSYMTKTHLQVVCIVFLFNDEFGYYFLDPVQSVCISVTDLERSKSNSLSLGIICNYV